MMGSEPVEITLDSLTTRTELQQAVLGRTTAEIVELVERLGVHDVLLRVFDRMERDFDPLSAPPRTVVIEWVIEQHPDEQWTMTASETACTVTPGPAKSCDVSLGMSVATFLRVISGASDGLSELSKGNVRINGDLTIAASIDSWFAVAD